MPGDIAGFTELRTVIMAAMMLPSVTPAVLLFATVAHTRAQVEFTVAPTAGFVGGCFGLWMAAGAGVALADQASGGWVSMSPWGRALAGGALVAAGICQFTPWKMACLGYCREPLQFFMGHWRDGLAGAVHVGAYHGLYCLGCCWGLTLALITLGMMNPLWMLASALVILAETVAPWGARFAPVIGAAQILGGIGIATGCIPLEHAMPSMEGM
jgi:predicted metal-binding membrane protein